MSVRSRGGVINLNLKDSISLQVLKSVFGLYLFMALILTGVQIYFEFENTKQNMIVEMKEIEKSFSGALETAIFNLDDELINAILLGIYKNSAITGVKVIDENEQSIQAYGKTPKKGRNSFKVEFEIFPKK